HQMFEEEKRLFAAKLRGRQIDRMFMRLGIDPALASCIAFEAVMVAPIQIGGMMALRRISQEITRNELASRLGYRHDTIANWELGRTSPKIASVADWAQALGLQANVHLAPRDHRGQG